VLSSGATIIAMVSKEGTTADQILSSVTGEWMVILQNTPALLRFELFSPPKQPSPPRAAHPIQEERFQVLDGHLCATIGDTTQVYGPNETFVIPADTFHVVRNTSAEPARAIVAFAPATRMLSFFEELMGLTRISPMRMARLVKRHRDAVVLAPPFAQLLGLLSHCSLV